MTEQSSNSIAVQGYQLAWKQQLGSTGIETSNGIAVDNQGNTYITGATSGSLAGSNAGERDAWIAKYSPEGQQLWLQQLGSAGDDTSKGIAVDNQGNSYVTGATSGKLTRSNAGSDDAWIAKYSPEGKRLWLQQLGSAEEDVSNGIAVDNQGNAYITGYTSGNLSKSNAGNRDAWIAKYSPKGQQLWLQQLGGTGIDISNGIAVDNQSNAYITGYTSGNLTESNTGNRDAWIAKYSPEGQQLWLQQLGSTGIDIANGIAVDHQSNAYITGTTSGKLASPNAGSYDAWIAMYSAEGQQLWLQQLGSASDDAANGITVDNQGNAYITGYTSGKLTGSNAGNDDAWVAKYSPKGQQLWLQQLGSAGDDAANGIAVDNQGSIYLTGYTSGNFAGSNAGKRDAWVAKLILN